MAELKTKETGLSVKKFLDSISDDEKRDDAYAVLEMMKKSTKAEPKMWGSNIVGFGNHHLVYESGRELDWFLMGFSPRKQNLTLYIPRALENTTLTKKLGKFKNGKGCLYIKNLKDVDESVLKKLMDHSVKAQ